MKSRESRDRAGADQEPRHQEGLEELRAFIAGDLEEADVPLVRRLLRHPYADQELVEAVMARPRLLTSYKIRRDIARHPKSPQVHAMRFLPGLYWRDLLELSVDTRLLPVLRRSAERQILERLPGLSLGERMAIARRAGHGLLMHLRHDGHQRVIAAMMENPRMTQGVIMPLVASDGAAPEILRLVAANRRWGRLYMVRLALARNPRTPPVVACDLLSGLRKNDIRAVSGNQRLAPQVRRRAKLLLGEG
ncbi:MAG: hypothetical protein SX243_06010 [Acidobacteriota bacterium]|nr:hypothetical protein [Acidobacteriota bacterium]